MLSKAIWAGGGVIVTLAVVTVFLTFAAPSSSDEKLVIPGNDPELEAAAAEAFVEEASEDESEPYATAPAPSAAPEEEFYTVLKVVDGDTLAIDLDGASETIRLIGIDTPETVDTREPVQCYGKEASQKTAALLTAKKVSIEKDPVAGERDKYSRLLAYVFLPDGTNVNRMLIEEGYAYEYTYNNQLYKYQAEFKAAQESAKLNERGLWAPDACEEEEPAPKPKATLKTKAEPEPAKKTTTKSQTTTTSEDDSDETSQSNVSSSSYTCSVDTYNCTDFATHDEAQEVYDACGGASNDIHKLDSDKDGESCESLP